MEKGILGPIEKDNRFMLLRVNAYSLRNLSQLILCAVWKQKGNLFFKMNNFKHIKVEII